MQFNIGNNKMKYDKFQIPLSKWFDVSLKTKNLFLGGLLEKWRKMWNNYFDMCSCGSLFQNHFILLQNCLATSDIYLIFSTLVAFFNNSVLPKHNMYFFYTCISNEMKVYIQIFWLEDFITFSLNSFFSKGVYT